MKKPVHIILLCKAIVFTMICAFIFTNSIAQEKLKGGSMEESDEGDWIVYWSVGTGENDPYYTFGYDDNCPSAGQGDCLAVEWFAPLRVQIYQPVTIELEHSYELTGAYKNISSVTCNMNWLELILTRSEPNVEGDWLAVGGDFRYQMHSWKGEPYQNIDEHDGTFESLLPLEWLSVASDEGDSLLSSPLVEDMPPGGDNLTCYIPDTVTTTDWFVVIKFGRTATGDEGAVDGAFTFLFDNISLWDLAEAKPSGIKNVDYANEFSIYPNPSTGIVNIKKSGEMGMTYELYNTLGMMVKSGNLDSPYELDLRNISKGLYFINITYGSRKVIHKLILK